MTESIPNPPSVHFVSELVCRVSLDSFVDTPRATGPSLSSLLKVFKFKCTSDALAFEVTELAVWV